MPDDSQVTIIKGEIVQLLAHNFGDPTAKTFHDFNHDETLSIFIGSAYELLKDLIGDNKAREQIDAILGIYKMTIHYV